MDGVAHVEFVIICSLLHLSDLYATLASTDLHDTTIGIEAAANRGNFEFRVLFSVHSGGQNREPPFGEVGTWDLWQTYRSFEVEDFSPFANLFL